MKGLGNTILLLRRVVEHWFPQRKKASEWQRQEVTEKLWEKLAVLAFPNFSTSVSVVILMHLGHEDDAQKPLRSRGGDKGAL